MPATTEAADFHFSTFTRYVSFRAAAFALKKCGALEQRGMYWRHEEIVRLSAWPTKVEAQHFNLAKRANARLGGEIRLPMRGLKTLDLIIQDRAWIIVDRALNDLPIAAWTDFEVSEGRGLHEPVICELRYYHGHAGLVIKKVLRRMEEELTTLLNSGEEESGQVIAFRPRPD